MTGTTDIQIVRNLDSIVPEWQNLFDHCSNATPFQSPAWLRPWWRQFGQGDPFAVVVRKHNRFAGLGLFYIYEGDPFRRAQLFFLGKSVSDYLDILVADGENASTVAQQIFDYLFESAHDWHHADLDRLRSNSAVLSVRPHLQISEKRVQEGVCPEVHLAGPRIRQITTKNTRNAIRKHMNHAFAMGKVDFVTADRANYFRLLQNLIEFHSVPAGDLLATLECSLTRRWCVF